jgi:hypothetical protein
MEIAVKGAVSVRNELTSVEMQQQDASCSCAVSTGSALVGGMPSSPPGCMVHCASGMSLLVSNQGQQIAIEIKNTRRSYKN